MSTFYPIDHATCKSDILFLFLPVKEDYVKEDYGNEALNGVN